jgi:hypothetical protein
MHRSSSVYNRKKSYNIHTIFIHVNITYLAEMPWEKSIVQGIMLPPYVHIQNYPEFQVNHLIAKATETKLRSNDR